MGKFAYWKSQSYRTLNHWQDGASAGGGTGGDIYGPADWEYSFSWADVCGFNGVSISRVYTGAYSSDMSKFYFAAPNIKSKRSGQIIHTSGVFPTYFSPIPFTFGNWREISKVYGYLENTETTAYSYQVHQYGAIFDLGLQYFQIVPIVTNAGNIKIVGPLNTETLTPDSNGAFRHNVMLPIIHSYLVCGSIARAPQNSSEYNDNTPDWMKGGVSVDMSKDDAVFKPAEWSSYGDVFNKENILSKVIAYNLEFFNSHGITESHDDSFLFGRNGASEQPLNLAEDSSGWKDGNFGWNHAPFAGFNTAGPLFQPTVAGQEENTYVWSGSSNYYTAAGTYPLIDNTFRSLCYDMANNNFLDSFVQYYVGTDGSVQSSAYGDNIVFPSGLLKSTEAENTFLCGTDYINTGKLFSGNDMKGWQYGRNGNTGLYCATVINLLQDYQLIDDAVIATTTGYTPPIPEPTPGDDTQATIDSAVTWAVNIANDSSHGYDQAYRWGERGDYDCSSFVITAWENAGVPVKSKGATYTGNMYSVFTANGFSDVTSQITLSTGDGLQKGDVLLNTANHTAMCVDASQIVQASINENGGVSGGQPGDQTGEEIWVRSYYNYPWDYVLRYTG